MDVQKMVNDINEAGRKFGEAMRSTAERISAVSIDKQAYTITERSVSITLWGLVTPERAAREREIARHRNAQLAPRPEPQVKERRYKTEDEFEF